MNLEKKNIKYGFSQGRLTIPYNGELQCFPQYDWQNEFINAGLLGCSFIELLVEREKNNLNPIWSNEGRFEILELCTKNKLKPYSICLDYIINHSLLDDPRKDSFKSIENCIEIAVDLDAHMVILPLLEESNLAKKNFLEMAQIIKKAACIAKQCNVYLCIESLVSVKDLNEFISLINMSNVKAVFDTGNRVIETPDLYNEILNLSENLGHIHIKDKDRFGNNVILGSGMVDFCGVFDALNKINFCGALNFETNRGSVPLHTARHNIKFCEFFLENSQKHPNLN